MTVNLRGLGDGVTIPTCYQSTACRATTDVACYGPGWFTDFCSQWRAYDPSLVDIPAPPAPVTTSGPAPDINAQGQVSSTLTPDQIATQIAQAGAAQNLANNLAQIGNTAAGLCAQLKASCGAFTSPNADCTDCIFDPSKPLFLVLVFGIGALLIAKPWK